MSNAIQGNPMGFTGAVARAGARTSGARAIVVVSLLAFGVGAVGCGAASSQEQLNTARASLASGAYDDAIAAADAGLAASPEPIAAWGLEVVKLEALSRAGRGDASVAQLEKLVAASPERVSAAEYSGTAQRLRAAEQKVAAVRVLDLGHKRFPNDAVINKMIADSVETGVDPAELEMLKSLGYID